MFVMFQMHAWEPTVDNSYRGLVVWSVPENISITISLFRDAKQGHYEDKEWTFVVEDVSNEIKSTVQLF
jgi:N-terminal C2 in EEIG1 and EHBP1 proteins